MVNKILSLCTLFFIIACSENSTNSVTDDGDDHVVKPKIDIAGYLPDYRIEAISESFADQITELIYFSIEPKTNGDLDLTRINAQTLSLLQKMKNEHGLRLTLAVGGWGRSDGFAAMSTTKNSRDAFIENLRNYCLENYFNGIDYDWEFPSNTSQRAGYDSLIVNTKRAVANDGITVSVALNPYQTLAKISYEYLDKVNLMSYDHSGRHATYEQALLDVNQMLNQGIDKKKIRLGVPFYGRKISDFSQAITYREIVTRYDPDPAVDEIDGYFFNGLQTIANKTEYAITTGLAGIMIWELGQDSYAKKSLLEAIYNLAVEIN